MRDDIIQILSAELGMPGEELTQDVHLRGVAGMDSMKVLSIILKVEKRFGIEIPDDATFRLETVGQFTELVESLAAPLQKAS
ncbi:acyl carrier protein [Pyxidicoccus fallax]|uniref:Acyl carrier protein n=1 Tax=Pyxidicoccus fallax TaxID=394095 RepID=A0A848LFP6_9BACT|nr:acyl carrier protein [Pyxidicoccus fallax]NMO17324.1 acyl carrier protein [Pyxidicoccus fallax]NPC78957.1 acyl carrier protein [Pyxidicoccus fallax]